MQPGVRDLTDSHLVRGLTQFQKDFCPSSIHKFSLAQENIHLRWPSIIQF